MYDWTTAVQDYFGICFSLSGQIEQRLNCNLSFHSVFITSNRPVNDSLLGIIVHSTLKNETCSCLNLHRFWCWASSLISYIAISLFPRRVFVFLCPFNHQSCWTIRESSSPLSHLSVLNQAFVPNWTVWLCFNRNMSLICTNSPCLCLRLHQTVEVKSQAQQCPVNVYTQMTGIGCYVSCMNDKLVAPSNYITADQYHDRRLKAVGEHSVCVCVCVWY